jgi:2-succinyl-5-enolpyruvyl-6-hydroxy-3-cyclohexene-1-carboxylate synthase
MGNIDRAARLIDELRAEGVSEYCVCAGSRNTPLLAVLGAAPDLRLFSFVDERSAGFFALGRMKRHGAPVAVVTTSGTAVAELLPAAVEAHYAGLPLVIASADRPARYRGTGAPQSIEQVGIFGVYAETSFDTWSRRGALHLNLEFDEPLIDGDPRVAPRSRIAPRNPPAAMTRGRFRIGMKRPLVIVGGLPPHRRDRVREFVRGLNAPTFAEPLSGLREDASLPLITSGERMIGRATFDGVIRIGNVPTLRFWRDLEDRDVPVAHFSDLPFSGLTRGELRALDDLPELEPLPHDDDFFAVDRRQAEALGRILDEEPQSELAMIRRLSRELSDGTAVYLGNSLPIREWDLAASRESRGFDYEANRGANGIDGQLSTFLGWSDPSRDNVCVVGDLTALYDMNAPWIVPQLGHARFRIVIVNNGGGRIFGRVSSLRAFDPALRGRIVENEHALRFEQWASMWGIEVIELRPDAAATRRSWERYDALWE